jgi:hypothetical protein
MAQMNHRRFKRALQRSRDWRRPQRPIPGKPLDGEEFPFVLAERRMAERGCGPVVIASSGKPGSARIVLPVNRRRIERPEGRGARPEAEIAKRQLFWAARRCRRIRLRRNI